MNEANEILEHFDSIFGTKTSKHIKLNMQVLKLLYQELGDKIYSSSPRYNNLRKKQIGLSDKLYSTFTKEQKKMFEEYWEYTNQMAALDDEQLFFTGYLLAKEFDNEGNIKE
jgi:hypothetical protein